MARQHRTQPSDNLDRWLVSYADFITLLFAFFVVMYAISAVNEGKYKIFSTSLTNAFGGPRATKPEAGTENSEQGALLKSLVDRRNARQAEQLLKQQEYMQNVGKELNQVMAPLVKEGQVRISQNGRGVVLEINASALFSQGDAELHRDAMKVLAQAAELLQLGDQAIEVQGYTDNVPIKSSRFPSNWELSSARASSVARLFIDYGVEPARLSVVGSAANNPVASNDTAEGRARNRRIAVTILTMPAEHTTQKPGEIGLSQ